MTHFKKALAFFLTVFLSACGGNGNDPSPADNSKDREVILTHWVDNIIIPSYESFRAVFDVMIEKSIAFTSSPDEASLLAFREAWGNAYLAWQKVELFEFGPADKYTLRNFFNIYPADINGIIANVNDPSANLDLASTYATQGFPALDYLLNGIGESDASILAAYTTDADAGKRLAYIDRISSRMHTLLTSVITDWKGTYRDTFVSKTGLDIGSSFGVAVNAYTLHYERYIRSGKVGIPSGAAIGSTGIPYPEKVEAYYKNDISRALAENAHAAARDFFDGKSASSGIAGPSFGSYLDALGAKDAATGTLLSGIIDNQFDLITGELSQLTPSLSQQIQTDNGAMIDTYAAMQALVRMLKVDMTSAMSVTVTYTDNDGD